MPPDRSPTRNFMGSWKPRRKPHLYKQGDHWLCSMIPTGKPANCSYIGIGMTPLEAQRMLESAT